MKENKLKRTQVCITPKQYSSVKKESEEMGVSMSELLRRILDERYETKLVGNSRHGANNFN